VEEMQVGSLLPGMSNRHGLVAGATGTGKTVTLQVMAEALSSIGVPVFAWVGLLQSDRFEAKVVPFFAGRDEWDIDNQS